MLVNNGIRCCFFRSHSHLSIDKRCESACSRTSPQLGVITSAVAQPMALLVESQELSRGMRLPRMPHGGCGRLQNHYLSLITKREGCGNGGCFGLLYLLVCQNKHGEVSRYLRVLFGGGICTHTEVPGFGMTSFGSRRNNGVVRVCMVNKNARESYCLSVFSEMVGYRRAFKVCPL